ncbi:fibrinogen-like protein 1 isoform X2 [Mizuhopecten yessoensis]|uniref:fibrinogen-like protein 1 isoform X2 n=1 Tax=Mizuhopecten yessoensis TaxID=6573 RepID=UPI000B45DA05|nr:fibrinogen-like protein 1 isoform X2 [Mizuhopecten yessoensis]
MKMRCSRWIKNIALTWLLCNGLVEAEVPSDIKTRYFHKITKGSQEDQGSTEKTEVRKRDLGLGVFPRGDCLFRHSTSVLGLFARLLCSDEGKGDCEEVLKSPVETYKPNGVYDLRPDSNAALFALCDMDEGGWTIIQQRVNGKTDFSSDWEDYKLGFGEMNENEDFWLGNENIWRLTNAVTTREPYTLRIELTSVGKEKRFAEYSYFRIENEANKYRLNISNYSGNAGDAMHTYNGMDFSTNYDHGLFDSCSASYRSGGWWFNQYCHANLNGVYKPGTGYNGIVWDTWPEAMDTISEVRMMIRRKD